MKAEDLSLKQNEAGFSQETVMTHIQVTCSVLWMLATSFVGCDSETLM